jgi:hypothetical protein
MEYTESIYVGVRYKKSATYAYVEATYVWGFFL